MKIFIVKYLLTGLLHLKIWIFNYPQILIMKIMNQDLVLDGIDKKIRPSC